VEVHRLFEQSNVGDVWDPRTGRARAPENCIIVSVPAENKPTSSVHPLDARTFYQYSDPNVT
jgi:hypothetical protein